MHCPFPMLWREHQRAHSARRQSRAEPWVSKQRAWSTKTIQTSPTPKFKRHTKTPAEFPNVLPKSQLPEVVRKSREPSLLHQPRIETIRRLRKEKTLNHPTSTPKPVHDIDPSLFPIRHLVPPLLNYPFSSPKLSVNSNINSFSRKDPLLELIYENYLEEKKFKSTIPIIFKIKSKGRKVLSKILEYFLEM